MSGTAKSTSRASLERLDDPIGRVLHRVFFVTHGCYFETSNGASIATRAMMEHLARHGFAAGAFTGTVLDSGQAVDPAAWLDRHGLTFEEVGEARGSPITNPDGPAPNRFRVRGVDVMLHKCPTISPHVPDDAEQVEFLRSFERTMDQFHPDVVVSYGGDDLAVRVRRQARAMGAAVVCPVHHFGYRDPAAFADADAVLVPSRFAASYYRGALGLECTPLPNLVDFDRVRVPAAERDPRYVTFVNPSYEKGVYVFARIADELGRRRPDIPLLVVEARGTERTLVDCGLDLRAHGNVSMMGHTSNPRQFWRVARIVLLPSLWWENQPAIAYEAMINGVPVLGSDRGGIPETLGDAGTVLSLPSRLAPSTRELPTAREVEPWVKAIIGLWDDPNRYAEARRRCLAEARRWDPDVVGPMYVDFFKELSIRD